ncbi:MAG: UDP-N-acetylmuramoyl-tripeptide--D-alanyl-D-alanine ligase, partial [Myxococcota bacterium]
PVLAITGSNGKTTTKEMLAALLGVERCVLATEGNLNNLVGLPLTLLGLHAGHELCIAEMGMNALGEIARMTEIAEPEVGLVTNVGPAHIGELGSLDNISKAKGELFAGLPDGATAVVNLDDPRVRARADERSGIRKITFGRSPQAEVRLLSSEPTKGGQRLEIAHCGATKELELPLPGEHNAMNATGAWAAAQVLAPPPAPERAAEGLARLGDIGGRFSVRDIRGVTVIDDSYNANPASFAASAETARAWAGPRRLVVAAGEMHELGQHSESGHAEAGQALARAGAVVVAGFGSGASPLVAASGAQERRHEAEDFDALAHWLVERIRPGDVVLVKGSRGSRMERIIAHIEGGD